MEDCLVHAVDAALGDESSNAGVAKNVVLGCPVNNLYIGPKIEGA